MCEVDGVGDAEARLHGPGTRKVERFREALPVLRATEERREQIDAVRRAFQRELTLNLIGRRSWWRLLRRKDALRHVLPK